MRICFVSNYINHHQIPFCEALIGLGADFCFVQTDALEEERRRMGWQDRSDLPFVRFLDRDREEVTRRILEDDVVLMGWAPKAEETVLRRLEQGKLTFRISERIYKDGQWKAISPRGLIDKYRTYTRFRRAPYYLLCAGAYVGSDFSVIRAFPGKKLRFGYFPKTLSPDPDVLFERRRDRDVCELVWSGRFVDFKHVESVLELAENLRKEDAAFHLTIAGGGDGEEEIRERLKNEGLAESVGITGFLPPDEVRRCMENGDIFVFTSDAGEGWGAVVNEAMDSALAVVASNEAGAVPSLIRSGENGIIYPCGDARALAGAVKRLIGDPGLRERLGRQAQRTVTELWNASVGAERLFSVCESLLAGGEPERFGEGPLSADPCLRPFVRASVREYME